MIRAVIIDDNPEIRATNKKLLKEYFSDIELVGEAGSVENAYNLICKTNPQLVLLDIEIIGGTGFQLLQKLKPYNFKVIFVTAFNQYALKALKFHAIDYILKPVNTSEFIEAVQSTLELIKKDFSTKEQNELFLRGFNQKNIPRKIILRTIDAMHLVNISEIQYCKSDNNYTTFHLNSAEEIIVSKSMAYYEDILADLGFLRPHQSYLVNIQHIKKIDKTDGGFIILDNKKEIPISSRRKKHFYQLLEKL